MDRERLERILEVLAGAARGELTHRLEPTEDDEELIELEVAINSALEDLDSARNRAETQQREIDQKNQVLLSALYTPIISIWPGVLSLPIIGQVDSIRAATMLEALLMRVVAERATHVILDLTGVSEFDAALVQALLRMAQTLRLLGSSCLFSGISAAMAHALVQLGMDVGALRTTRLLSDALAVVLADKGFYIERRKPPQ